MLWKGGMYFLKTTDQPKLAVSKTPPSSAVNWPSVLTDHITELGLGVPEPAHLAFIFRDFWPNWARNRFAQFFRAFYTTSKPRKILPKQSSSNIFSWTKRSCSSALPGVQARGVCWSSYYHVRVRVFTELQNPEQNFYLVFWFLSDHRPIRTFKLYNSHWKKKS